MNSFPGATIAFVVSLAISLWLNLKSFLEPLQVLPELPISVDRCVNSYMGIMGLERFVPPVAPQWSRTESFAIHRISYVWYTAISVLVAFVVAIPASFLTGANNPRTMNPKLAARPFDVICPYLSKETRNKLAFHLGEDFVSFTACLSVPSCDLSPQSREVQKCFCAKSFLRMNILCFQGNRERLEVGERKRQRQRGVRPVRTGCSVFCECSIPDSRRSFTRRHTMLNRLLFPRTTKKVKVWDSSLRNEFFPGLLEHSRVEPDRDCKNHTM